LKTSIYIQIVIRWASIHRLSICIIDLPTTAKYKYQTPDFIMYPVLAVHYNLHITYVNTGVETPVPHTLTE
jgi:hypothetical protein